MDTNAETSPIARRDARASGRSRAQAADAGGAKQTDYGIELARIEKTVAELAERAFRPPTDTGTVITYVHAVYQHAVLTGDLAELESADGLIAQAIRQVQCPNDLCFLRANVAFKLHRLADVRRNLATVPQLAASVEARALLAELDFQEGRYAQARAGYESVVADNRTWDNLARLANFHARMGDPARADALYLAAQDEIGRAHV